MLLRGVKKGQVTIFIIIAIVIVAAVGIFFLLRSQTSISRIPSEFAPTYESFTFCLDSKVESGVKALESQGGYIDLPEFVSGSEYMPFSSQLNLLGNPIPYWYYVSGNNIEKEQVPSRQDMENDLSGFIESKVVDCIPEDLDEGFEITVGDPLVRTSIKPGEVQVNVRMDFTISKDDESVSINNHQLIFDSELGRLYSNAIIAYEAEQDELFLENYGVDVLRLYAPVDGVDFTCSPKVWSADEIFEDLSVAIQENTLSIKSQGNSEDYFVVDSLNSRISDGFYVKFLNSESWSSSFEVNPSDGPILIANAIGNQQGLGVLGFCYVPYHFVYNVNYPVLVQVYSENTDEFFQFPVAVVLRGNKAREAVASSGASTYEGPNICENKNTGLRVRTIDSNSNLVNSEIYFECFGDSCKIGDSENGILEDAFPQCVNGYIIAKAEGFEDTSVQITNIGPGNFDIIMNKLYDTEVLLNLDAIAYNGEATITFEREGFSQTLVYPTQKEISLSEGSYNISVYIYRNASLSLGSSVQQYCIDVPRAIGGSLGLTKEECFDVEVPEQIISNALSGGGEVNYYVSENQLSSASQIVVGATSLPEPNSLNQLQQNYVLFDSKSLEVLLR